MSQFFTLLTKTGQGLLANAIAYGQPLTIAEMAIGDGGGKLPKPDASVTRLFNEVRRGPINQTTTDPNNPNWTVVEQVLPAEVGGWTIREVGLYDTDGNLIAYGNYPETYKPQLSEGAARTQTIRFVMEVTDTSAVTLRIDPSVVMASRKYVDDTLAAHEKSRNHPDADTKNKGFVRFATLAESRKGEESKAAQTPAGGKAQLDDHRAEKEAHKAGQITLDQLLSVFGDAGTVQDVLALLGDASRKAVGENKGNVMPVGAFGWGIPAPDRPCYDVDATGNLGLYYARGDQSGTFRGKHPVPNGYVLWVTRPDDYANQIAFADGGVGMFLRSYVRGKGWTQWGEITHTANPDTIVNAIAATQAEVDKGEVEKAVTTKTLKGWIKQATESVFGLMRVATQSQVNAGTDDATAVTPKKLRWGVSYRISANGWIVFPTWLGGLAVQWGFSASVPGTSWATTSFPIAFANQCFHVFPVYLNGTATPDVGNPINVGDRKTTHFDMYNGGRNTATYSYLAIGY
ncbi:hypothetical protein GCM10010082_06010 [Kushneria pakistanensis]|uniref:Phage tail protein n=1 Tax=Kushneria pakistanensis TaxID=1508770 RepID=A0ABQ3FBV5_9GAMM|nr:phage tail protein [Kushneria pakistanensis]GHC17571.1 hypothetical protein GCM10010082_06010 [Kushneria pakistanensis]